MDGVEQLLDRPQGRYLLRSQGPHPMSRTTPSLRLPQGFTLIELLVTITVFVFLLLLALPMYSEFNANSRIRNATENTLMGVRQAQSEAVKHNGQVEFVLDGTGWNVNVIEDGSNLAGYAFTEGASLTTVSVLPPGATKVTFNGLGRIMPQNPDGSAPITRINVTSTTISNPRNMAVVVGAAGLKACLPAILAPDPAACP